MTVGPYRPIRIISYSCRISELSSFASVSDSLTPSLTVEVTLDGEVTRAIALDVVLRDLKGNVIEKQEGISRDLKNGELLSLVQWDLEGKVDLWWPVGYGRQDLYELEVTLLGPVRFFTFVFFFSFSLKVWSRTRMPSYLISRKRG